MDTHACAYKKAIYADIRNEKKKKIKNHNNRCKKFPVTTKKY